MQVEASQSHAMPWLDMNLCKIDILHTAMREQQLDVSCVDDLLDSTSVEEVLQMGSVECTNHSQCNQPV